MNDQATGESRVARMLSLGRFAPRRPVDLLIEDLREHGDGRLEELLRSGPAGRAGPATDLFLRGRADLELLRAIKTACQESPDPRAGLDDHLARLAGYFVAVASAIAHHDTRITRTGHEAFTGVFLDLAVTAPQPWSRLFEAAGGKGPPE